MITPGERHELKTEVKRLNVNLTDILRDYGHAGDVIPVLKHHSIWKDNRFLELMGKRKMLLKVLSIFNVRLEDCFKLLPSKF